MKKRQQEALERAPFFGGDPEGKIGELGRVSRYLRSDQRQPRLVRDRSARRKDSDRCVPEAKSRVQDAGRGGSFGVRSLQRAGGFQPVGTLHHARAAWLDAAGRVRELLSDRPVARFRRHSIRDGSRDSRHPARRTSAPRTGASVRRGKCARPLGGRHARRRDRRISSSAARIATPTPTSCGSWSASGEPRPTGSSGRSPLTIRRPGRSRGRSRCR